VNHIALRVDGIEELEYMKRRLQEAGIEVLGLTDHHIIQSLYFFDPNGIRLELTTETASDEEMEAAKKTAHSQLKDWAKEKAGRGASAA
jgi:catechol-2,3-dioxygenase